MQGNPQIGWQPGYDTIHPWEYKIWALYFFVMAVVFLVRLVGVARQLWFPRNVRTAASESEKTDQLAVLALAKRISLSDVMDLAVDSLPRADSAFLYEWEICATSVTSMKKLVTLTLLVGLSVFLVSGARILFDISTLKFTGSVGIVFVTAGLAPPLMQLAFSVLASAVLYCVSSFYEGVLSRRRASWNYIYRKAMRQARAEG